MQGMKEIILVMEKEEKNLLEFGCLK